MRFKKWPPDNPADWVLARRRARRRKRPADSAKSPQGTPEKGGKADDARDPGAGEETDDGTPANGPKE